MACFSEQCTCNMPAGSQYYTPVAQGQHAPQPMLCKNINPQRQPSDRRFPAQCCTLSLRVRRKDEGAPGLLFGRHAHRYAFSQDIRNMKPGALTCPTTWRRLPRHWVAWVMSYSPCNPWTAVPALLHPAPCMRPKKPQSETKTPHTPPDSASLATTPGTSMAQGPL
jgi:hypothetical protein